MTSADPLLHAKLDRLLTGQEEINSAIATLRAAMEILSQTQEVQRELLATLAQAVTDETPGDDMRELLASVEHMLKLLHIDGQHTAEILAQLPTIVSRAAQDGARLALGDAIDVPERGQHA